MLLLEGLSLSCFIVENFIMVGRKVEDYGMMEIPLFFHFSPFYVTFIRIHFRIHTKGFLKYRKSLKTLVLLGWRA